MPPLVLEEIRVQPPGGGEERVVRALLPLQPGAAIDADALLAARETLATSGYFKEVHVFTSRGSRRGAVVLHVETTLDRTAQFETGFGHEPLDGWYLNLVGVRWNSPWRRGGHVRVGAQLGQRTGGVSFELLRPQLLGPHVDFLVEARSETERWLVYEGDQLRDQRIERPQLAVGLRATLGSRAHATLWAGVSAARPDATLDGREGARDEPAGRLVPGAREENYQDARLDVRVDGRDPVTPWRRGAWAGVALRATRARDGADFWRADVEASGAVPLPAHAAFALRARGVYTGPGTPYHLRAVVGGAGSIRGFRDASLSGPQGARGAWQATGELRVPLVGVDAPRPRLVGLVFADVGNHWDTDGRAFGVSAGLGYGLRVRVPWIQVFGLDVGMPLTDDLTDDPFWVHGTLGFTF